MSGIAATVAGLATTLRFVCNTLGIDAALEFVEAIRDQFGLLTEGAVLADFTAASFTKGTSPMSVLHTVAQTVADHAHIWAAPEPTPTGNPTGGGINTVGIMGWIASRIFPVIIGGIAVVVGARAAKGNVSQTMTTSVIVVIAVVMFAGAIGLVAFGNDLVNVIFG